MKAKNPTYSSALRATKRKSDRSTAPAKNPNFGEVIRRRRRELGLTQAELASRIKISPPYIGNMESGRRRPSNVILMRLAKVLGLEDRELFFLANPQIEALLSAEPRRTAGVVSAWDQFRNDERLRRIHNVSKEEMELLSQVARLGELHSTRDLIYILNTVRHALRK